MLLSYANMKNYWSRTKPHPLEQQQILQNNCETVDEKSSQTNEMAVKISEKHSFRANAHAYEEEDA